MVYVRLCVCQWECTSLWSVHLFFLVPSTRVCLNNLLMGVCFGVRMCVARFVVVSFLYCFSLLQRSLYVGRSSVLVLHAQNKRLLGISFFLFIRSLRFTRFRFMP